MISNKTNLNYGLYFFKTISLVVCIISHFIVLSHPPLNPHNSVHFKFCFLQWQQSMQSVFQLHLMRSLHCRLEALQLMFYNLVLFFFSIILHLHLSMLISSDYVLLSGNHMLQNMNKKLYREIFKIYKIVQQNAVITSNVFALHFM